VGSLENRLSRLEKGAVELSGEAARDAKLERERAIMVMIVDECARLKASGEQGTTWELLARAVHNVVVAQYADLGEELHKYIADGWIETLRSWSRLEGMVKAGREGPPRAEPDKAARAQHGRREDGSSVPRMRLEDHGIR
jgi:hypothetical protein